MNTSDVVLGEGIRPEVIQFIVLGSYDHFGIVSILGLGT